MTYRNLPSRHMDNSATIDELLLEAGLSDDADMRAALLSLQELGNVPAPAPGPELAAMLAGPHDQLAKRRWQRKHRTAVVSVAVVAAMGLGVSGVAAASSGFTKTPTIISGLFGNPPQHANAPTPLPVPDAPRVVTEPAPAEAKAAGGSPVEPTESNSAVRQAGPQQPTAPQPATPSDPTPQPATSGAASPGQSPAEPGHGTVPGSKDLPAVADQAARNAKPGQNAKPGETAVTTPGRAFGPGSANQSGSANLPGSPNLPGSAGKSKAAPSPVKAFPLPADRKEGQGQPSLLDRLSGWFKPRVSH